MLKTAFALSITTLMLAACAPSTGQGSRADIGSPGPDGVGDPATTRRCFQSSQINNFRADSQGVLRLRVGSKDVYELRSGAGCLDLESAFQIAVTPGVGSSSLCVGDWADVTTRDGVCRAQINRRLTDEDLAALEPRQRP